MDVKDFLKKYEQPQKANKAETTNTKKIETKKTESKNENVNAFLNKYKNESLKQQIPQSVLDSLNKVSTFKDRADTAIKNIKPVEINPSYAGDVISKETAERFEKPTSTTNTTTDFKKAEKDGTLKDWIQDQEQEIRWYSQRDQIDYIQDFYDVLSYGFKSQYLKGVDQETLLEDGFENARAKYTSELEKQRNTSSYWTNFKKNVINPLATIELGFGEGSGGGGIAKEAQRKIQTGVAALESIRGNGTFEENYKDIVDNTAQPDKVLNDVFEKSGGNKPILGDKDNPSLRSLANTAGYIGTGTVLTAAGVPAPVAYGTLSGANTYGKTDDVGDIAFETAIGAVYGTLSNYVGGKVGKTIQKAFPAANIMSSSPEAWAVILKNVLQGGGGTYTAQAVTGETRNVYNLLRGREVTKEAWIEPLWSKKAFFTTLIGMALGGISGTQNDIKARNQFQQDYNALETRLKGISREINNFTKEGNIEEAAKLAQQGLDEIRKFTAKEYGGQMINDEAAKMLKQTWNDSVIDIARHYAPSQSYQAPEYPTMLQQGQVGQASDVTSLPPNIPPQSPQNIQTNQPTTQEQQIKSQNSTQNTTQKSQNSTQIPTEKSQNSIQGLEDFTEDNIKDMITDHIEEVTEGNVKIKDISIKDGKVTVTYDSDLAVDTMDKALNTDPLNIEGVEVKITPVKYENEIEDDDLPFEERAPYTTITKDNQGRKLTKEQQNFFKDSKVVDDKGDLIVVYHGTQNGGFTEFHGFTFFTDSQDTSRSYSGSIENITKNTFESGQRTTIGNYQGYLNLQNPYIIDLNGAEWGTIDISSLNIPNIEKWIHEAGVTTWENEGKTLIGTDDIVSIVDEMNNQGADYDGIILKNIRDNGMRANSNDNLANDYVAFKGREQFKAIDNTTPTSNPDILKEDSVPYDKKVDINEEKAYNTVERKQEPRNYVSKKITNEDKARVAEDFSNNKKKYVEPDGFVQLAYKNKNGKEGYVVYGYSIVDGDINITSKFTGSTPFIEKIKKGMRKYGLNRGTRGDIKVADRIRRKRRPNTSSNAISRRSKEGGNSNRQTFGLGRQRKQDNEAKNNGNFGKNLKNSKQSSFLNGNKVEEKKAPYNANSNPVVRTINQEALQKLAKELDTSANYIEAGIGSSKMSAKDFITTYTNIVDNYIKENNITFPKKYTKVGFARVKGEKLQKFAKDNNLTVTKLANNEKLLNEYLDIWFDDLITEIPTEDGKKYLEETKNKWKNLFKMVKDTGNTPPALELIDDELDYINKGITEVEDTSQNWYNRREVINSKEFNDYIDKKLEGLFDENVYDVDDVMEEAKENHGTTDDYSTGAYMTTDGKLLDFNYGGYRDDHRSISAYDMSMVDFMNYGAIRMQPESHGFELATEPTEAQYERLADYIDNYLAGDEINVDIDIGGKNNYDTATYKANTPSEIILDDIRYYFENGHFPNKSEYAEFLHEERTPYSINDGFYSQVEKVISTKMANKADGQTIMNLLNKNGAKRDELDWLDMDNFLKSKDSFTKQEVLDYIRANQLQLEEIELSAKKIKEQKNKDVEKILDKQKEIIKNANYILGATGNYYSDAEIWFNNIYEGSKSIDDYFSIDDLDADDENYIDEILSSKAAFEDLYDEWEENKHEIDMIESDDYNVYSSTYNENEPRHEGWTTNLGKGSNYKEILFTLPYFNGKPYFKEEHWGDRRNVIAHTRLKDYIDDSNAKVLFAEEIQSDLHQEGRKYGYEDQKEIDKAQKEHEELLKQKENIERELHETDEYKKKTDLEKQIKEQFRKAGSLVDNFNEKWGIPHFNLYSEVMDRASYDNLQGKNKEEFANSLVYAYEKFGIPATKKDINDMIDEFLQTRKEIQKLNKERHELEVDLDVADISYMSLPLYDKAMEISEKEKNANYKLHSEKAAPSSAFPFKKTWHEFVIRKIINEAVKNGYDKVAWTTGKQQNDRYTLSKYIDRLDYIKDGTELKEGYYIYGIKNGSEVLQKHVSGKDELEQLVGKTIAERIINSEEPNGKIEGIDLEVGGEGMKGFYDKIIPDYVSKYIKKWGGKLEDVVIGGNHQQGFTITPEMKKAVETEGQMLFEPRTGYNANKVAGTPTILSTSKGKSNKPQVVGNRIWEGFQETGYTDVTGTKVNGEQDIAEVSQIYRNPNFETFRIVYTKGGKTPKEGTIVGTEAVSSKIPGETAISTEKDRVRTFEKIRDRMKRLGADGYYLVHNHPTGVAEASREDINVTKSFKNNVEGLLGHVIVNNGTYAFIDTDLNVDNERQVDSSNALYHGSQFQTALKSNKTPWTNQTITSRDDLAALMYNLKNDDNYSSLILRGARGAVNAIIDVPNKFFNMSKEQVEGYIRNESKRYGATEAFIGTTSEEAFDKIKNLENVMDSILYQNGIVEGTKKLKGVFNNAKSTPTRVAEESAPYDSSSEEKRANRLSVVKSVLEELGVSTKGNTKALAEISDAIVQHIENGTLTEEQIQRYVQRLGDEIMQTDDTYYNENKAIRDTVRQQKLYVSEAVKNGFADWNDFRKKNIGSLRLTSDSSATPVDTFYKELNEMYGNDMFPLDIANASDELVKMSEVVKSIRKVTKSFKAFSDEMYGEKAWKEISENLADKIRNYRDNYELISNTTPPGKKTRKLADSMQRSDYIPENLKQRIIDNPQSKYDPQSNQETLENAKRILETNENARDEFLQNELRTAEDSTIAILLMNKAIQDGDLDEFDRISVAFLEKATNAGQVVQALSMLNRLTPEGMLMYGKRQLESAIKRLEKENPKLYKELKKRGELPKLSREKEKDIIERMKKIEKMPDGRKKTVEIAKVLTDIANEIPSTALEKVASLRITGLLLNLKTLNRNLSSNLSFSTLEMIKDIPATGIDYLTSLVTGKRTTKLPSLKTYFKNWRVGLKEATEDLVEGVDTGNGTKFSLPKKTFKRLYTYKEIYEDLKKGAKREFMKKAFNRMLSDAEDTAAFFVNGTDRPFWKARFETELKNQMELAGLEYGVDMPSDEMRQIAYDSADYATFKNKNLVSDVLRGIKNAANLNNPIGAGDLVLGLTFPGIPGGVASKISDYTFGGAVKVVKEIYNASVKNGKFDQRRFADMLGRVITGMGAIGLGVLLFKKHILFGGYDDDKDIADMQKATGMLDNSINVSALKRWFKGQSTDWRNGDQFYTFDYMQPFSALPIMGIDMYNEYQNDGNVLNALYKGAGTMISQISEMSAISQIRNLFRYGELEDNLLNQAISSVTSFIPTLSNNAAQYFDETSRITKDNTSVFNTFTNIIKNKIPFVRNTLEPKVDALGNDVIQYKDGNSFFATFVDPGYNAKYNVSDLQNEIMNTYNATGRRDIFPRVAPKTISYNDEKKTLTTSETVTYQRTSGKYVKDILSKLIEEDVYKDKDYDDRAAIMKEVVDDSNYVAKASVGIETNDYKKLKKKLDELDTNNIPYEKYYEAYLAQLGVEGDKNAKGNTIALTPSKNKKSAIDKALGNSLSKRQMEVLYDMFEISEKVW